MVHPDLAIYSAVSFEKRIFLTNRCMVLGRGAKFMPFWLMKSEPDELSIHDLQEMGRIRWDGVRNYQARNFLRAMQDGELFFFYHSSCPEPGIAGIGRIAGNVYPDPTALDEKSPYFAPKASAGNNPWSALDVEFVEAFPSMITLARLRGEEALQDLPLVHKGSRLSVMPVGRKEWTFILGLL
jgi:predicted RNA-binding protein with PUA-like domain